MELLRYMKAVRRHLHSFPCLSGQERETADFLAAELEKLGYCPQRCADTGLYCDLQTAEDKPWLLFRADIDALPIGEATGLTFASQRSGIMHACGHDGHAAMLMGAALLLRNGQSLPYNIRFLFQPAEEIGGGAKRMLEAGALPEHTTGAFAIHIWPSVPKGIIALRKGTLMASNDRFIVQFKGKSAHCAMHREGKDALQAGVDFVRALDRASDALPSGEKALVFVGSITAGRSYNVVADAAEIQGTVRTMSDFDRDRIQKEITRAAATPAGVYGVEPRVEYVRQYPPLVCDENAVSRLLTLLPEAREWPSPFLTAEDFAFFTRQVPGAMLLLGSGERAHCEPLHSARFTFDEELLLAGCRAFETIAKRY